jgi:hypothetical protein
MNYFVVEIEGGAEIWLKTKICKPYPLKYDDLNDNLDFATKISELHKYNVDIYLFIWPNGKFDYRAWITGMVEFIKLSKEEVMIKDIIE